MGGQLGRFLGTRFLFHQGVGFTYPTGVRVTEYLVKLLKGVVSHPVKGGSAYSVFLFEFNLKLYSTPAVSTAVYW